ncbi:type VI secretion protein, partial [Vibrio cholerae]
ILYLTGIKDTSSVKEANCITSDASLITESINNIALSETNKGTESLLSADDVYHVSTASDMSKIMQVNTFNRDSAFHQLREISDYFRRSEPHSPVSFLLEKAIRWGYLSLPELLQEMISRDERISLDKVFNVIGLDHYEKVLLPDVSQHNVGIQQSSISVGTIGEAKVQTVEAKTAEVSSSDVPFNQKSEKDKPSGSTALRW